MAINRRVMAINRSLIVTICFSGVFLIVSSLRGARVCCDGDQWLKMSQQERNIYVAGFMQGMHRGYERACEIGTRTLKSTESGAAAIPQVACMRSVPQFSMDNVKYAGELTELYSLHPKARDIYMWEGLEALANGKSVAEIAESYVREKPQTR